VDNQAQAVATSATSPRITLLEPLTRAPYRLFWIGEVVSKCGDEFQTIALATVAIALTGKSTALASILMVQNLPMALLLLFGGLLVDRYGSRRVLIATNMSLGVLALVLAGYAARLPLSVAALYVYALVTGAVRPFYHPAFGSMTPTLVPRSNLPAANALSRMGLDVSRSIAAPIAGKVIASYGVVAAFVVNAVTFLQAAGLQTRIRTSSTEQRKPSGTAAIPIRNSVFEGLRAVKNDPVLTGMMLAIVIWYLGFIGALNVGIAGFAQITLKAGPQGQGVLLAAFGIGNLAGSIVAGSRRNMGGVRTVMLITVAAQCLGFTCMMLGHIATLCAIPLLFAGMANAYLFVFGTSLIHSRAAPAVRGRVMAVTNLCSFGVYPISYALAATVADNWGPKGVIVVLGITLPALSVVVSSRVKEFWAHRLDVR